MNYITAQEQVNNNDCECEFTETSKKVTEILDIYNKKYDYDDMKIAICIGKFYNENQCNRNLTETEDFDTFEDIITLAVEIKNNWQIDYDNGALTQNEIGYIQEYAFRYLKEKYNIGGD